MQMCVFSIPMEGDEAAEEACNAFLRAHKVLAVDKHPVVVQGRQFWSVCVEYLPRRHGEPMPGRSASAPAMDRPRTDYRELLTTEPFARFCKLRELRKRLAEQDATPVALSSRRRRRGIAHPLSPRTSRDTAPRTPAPASAS